MKLVYFVQGEGRGHMAQSIALKNLIESRNHEVIAVFIGVKNFNNDLPDFFTKEYNCPIFKITSPIFITDKKNKGINLSKSIFHSIINIPSYLKSVYKIKKELKKISPDAFISFYEPLLGFYLRLFKSKIPSFFIGHQYFMNHPAFSMMFQNIFEKLSFKIYNNFTTTGKSIKLALSFSKETDQPNKNIYICPPLIRLSIINKKPENKNFILSYILNSGYIEDLLVQAKTNQNLNIESFSKKVNLPSIIPSNIKLYPLSTELFVNKLSTCSAYISTAGFDSISEAVYLQKQICLVPTKGHMEQKYNAIDAERCKIGIKADTFDLKVFNNKKVAKKNLSTFKNWVTNNRFKIVDIIEKNTIN